MFDALQNLTPETQQIMHAIIAQFMENSIVTRMELFDALNREALPGDIVFAGDSITEGYPVHELYPRNLPVYNRGIGGITSKQLLEHLDGHILGLQPEKVFLLIGTNDLARGDTPEEISGRIREICERTIKACPNVKLYVIAVYPTNTSEEKYAATVGGRENALINQLNGRIHEIISDMEQANFVNLNGELTDGTGNLMEEYTTDGLHLSVKGYQKITTLLLSYVGF